MTAPAVDVARLAFGLLLGAGLGVLYGLLRPRQNFLTDGLFVLALGYAWLYHSFAICRGDIRLGYTAALFLGWWGFDATVGRLLRPLFDLFWQMVGWILRPVRKIYEFFIKFSKKVFASLKKKGYNKLE